jgi:hypothetical protein
MTVRRGQWHVPKPAKLAVGAVLLLSAHYRLALTSNVHGATAHGRGQAPRRRSQHRQNTGPADEEASRMSPNSHSVHV